MIRAWANVAMICSTVIIDKEKFSDQSAIPRKNILCKITYVAQGKKKIPYSPIVFSRLQTGT